MKRDRDKIGLAAIILIALAVRIGLMLLLDTWNIQNHWNFGWETGRIAESLASGRGFSSPFREPTGPTAWLTPIFPSILALIFLLTGVYTTSSAALVLLLNSTVSALTCIPIFYLARRVFGRQTAWITVAVFAVYPPAVWHSITTIWDTTAVAFCCVSLMYGLYKLEGNWNPRTAAAYGAAIGIVTLLNPVALVLLAVVSLAVLGQPARSLGWRAGVILIVATVAFSVTTPWLVRNYHHFNRVFLRSNLGLELRLGNSDAAWEDFVSGLGTSAMELGHPTIVKEEFQRYSSVGEVKYAEESMAEALDFIRNHPSRFLRLSWRRVHHFWLGDLGSKNEWAANIQTNLSLSWIKKACHLIPLPFMVVGVGVSLRRHLAVSPIIAFLAIFPAIYYVTHVSERYRFPAEPFILMFAGYGLLWSLEKLDLLPSSRRPGGASTEELGAEMPP